MSTYERIKLHNGDNDLPLFGITIRVDDNGQYILTKGNDLMDIADKLPETDIHRRVIKDELVYPLYATEVYKPDLSKKGILLEQVGTAENCINIGGPYLKFKLVDILASRIPELRGKDILRSSSLIKPEYVENTFTNYHEITAIKLINNTGQNMWEGTSIIKNGGKFWISPKWLRAKGIQVVDFNVGVDSTGIFARCTLGDNVRPEAHLVSSYAGKYCRQLRGLDVKGLIPASDKPRTVDKPKINAGSEVDTVTYKKITLQEGYNDLPALGIGITKRPNGEYELSKNNPNEFMSIIESALPETNVCGRNRSATLVHPIIASEVYKPDLSKVGVLLEKVGTSFEHIPGEHTFSLGDLLASRIPELKGKHITPAKPRWEVVSVPYRYFKITALKLINNTGKSMKLGQNLVKSGDKFWVSDEWLKGKKVGIVDFNIKVDDTVGIVVISKLGDNIRPNAEEVLSPSGRYMKDGMEMMNSEGFALDPENELSTVAKKVEFNDKPSRTVVSKPVREHTPRPVVSKPVAAKPAEKTLMTCEIKAKIQYKGRTVGYILKRGSRYHLDDRNFIFLHVGDAAEQLSKLNTGEYINFKIGQNYGKSSVLLRKGNNLTVDLQDGLGAFKAYASTDKMAYTPTDLVCTILCGIIGGLEIDEDFIKAHRQIMASKVIPHSYWKRL